MTPSLKHKIIYLACFAALLPGFISVTVALFSLGDVEEKINTELDNLILDNISHIADDVYGLCKTTNDLIEMLLDHTITTTKVIIEDVGGIGFSGRKVAWQAYSRHRKNIPVAVPAMTLGKEPVRKNLDAKVQSPLVDQVLKMTGTAGSLWQRVNKKGDMLCVASSIIKPDGKRDRIAAYLPAFSSENIPDPLLARVLKGDIFTSRVFHKDNLYISKYFPLVDKRTEVIGMIGVGMKIDKFKTIRQTIMKTKVGRTGYIFCLGAKGKQKGRYIISKNGRRDGENILDVKDPSGRHIIREMIRTALAAKPGEISYLHYHWQNRSDDVARAKTSAFLYFEPWDWVIGVGMYEDDYRIAKENVRSELLGLFWLVMLSGSIIMLLMVIIAYIMGSKMVRPLTFLIRLTQKIADGDLKAARQDVDTFENRFHASGAKAHGDRLQTVDETRQLVSAINEMTGSLDSLVGQVKNATSMVSTSAAEISGSAHHMEAVVAQQAASTTQVNTTSTSISTTSKELIQTIEQVDSVVEEAAIKAGAGQSGLVFMESTMNLLMEATTSISSKLQVISEKANNIDSVITAINKVAEQTGLLSLNASIEAEKAGEFGVGFSVVAREIRRLADQTAVATLDIEHMVKEMQSAVSVGVMEMDKFADDVRRGVKQITDISSQIGQIIDQVQDLGPQFDLLKQKVQNQTDGAYQISTAMSQLSEAAGQTKETLHEFRKSTDQLNSVVKNLQNETSQFTVS